MHSGTHIDAPCHISSHGKLFGGIKIDLTPSSDQRIFSKLTIDKFKLGVRKGVLVDVARFKKLAALQESYAITRNDIEETLEYERVRITKGDAVMLRTGYGRYYLNAPIKYLRNDPGLSRDGAKWLVRNGVSIVGADNLSLDALPTSTYDAHVETLVKGGVYTVKNLYLEELSKSRVTEFLFDVAPLKIIGATGSLIRPVAIATK